jgi:hypothetical protein
MGKKHYPIFHHPNHDAQFDSLLEVLKNDNQVREASGKPAVGTRIKTLLLPMVFNGYSPNFICTLLKSYLPHLEQFEIPEIAASENTSHMKDFKEAVAQGCPKLQHVLCSWFDGDKAVQEAINGVLVGCQKGLRSFRCWNFDDRDENNQKRFIMATLLEYHSDTLELIELEDSLGVFSSDLVGLFTKCKNLKKAKIRHDEEDGCAAIKFRDMARIEWACDDLQELWLYLCRPDYDDEQAEYYEESDSEDEAEDEDEDSHHQHQHHHHQDSHDNDDDNTDDDDNDDDNDDNDGDNDDDNDTDDDDNDDNDDDGDDDDDSDDYDPLEFFFRYGHSVADGPQEQYEARTDQMAGLVYERIGHLVKLETLCLGYGDCQDYRNVDWEESRFATYDLTLRHGWLEELSELKELRHFIMDSFFWEGMHQAEVEFMDTHWPRLEKISFGISNWEKITKEPHWQWLQKRRPHLQYAMLPSKWPQNN